MEIPIKNIFFLLSYAWDKLEEANQMEINSSDYNDAINLLTRVLVTGCRHIQKRGLDKSYINVTEEYSGVKGKINFEASLNKNLFGQGKSICSFDYFSSNIIHNQILKSVLRLLTRIKDIDKRLLNEVWTCFYRFYEVDEIDLRLSHFSQVRIHRNNYEYDFLLKVSKLILENSVLNEEEGKYHFKDFTRNEKAMAALFESFVRNFYLKEQSEFKVRREDIYWNAEAINNSNLMLLPKMQTDITLESGNHKIIIDTKYYKQTLAFNYSDKFHSNNLYQMYSYLTNLEKNMNNTNNYNCEGILLYPTVQREINESYKIGNHIVRIITIDLSQDWKVIHKKLLDILHYQKIIVALTER